MILQQVRLNAPLWFQGMITSQIGNSGGKMSLKLGSSLHHLLNEMNICEIILYRLYDKLTWIVLVKIFLTRSQFTEH